MEEREPIIVDKDETLIDRPPTRRAILVFKNAVSHDSIARIGEALKQAIETDSWPVVMGGIGDVRWQSVEEAPGKSPAERIRVFKDRADEWRWTAIGANNRKLATSGEGYANFDDAAEMAERLMPGVPVDMRRYLYLEIEGEE